MSGSGKTIILPSASEIAERLRKVNLGDNRYMEEKFYPHITKEAGRKLVAQGVVMMLTLAIADFVAEGYPPIMTVLLSTSIPRFIDALVDDKDVAEEAKTFYQKAVDATRAG